MDDTTTRLYSEIHLCAQSHHMVQIMRAVHLTNAYQTGAVYLVYFASVGQLHARVRRITEESVKRGPHPTRVVRMTCEDFIRSGAPLTMAMMAQGLQAHQVMAVVGVAGPIEAATTLCFAGAFEPAMLLPQQGQ